MVTSSKKNVEYQGHHAPYKFFDWCRHGLALMFTSSIIIVIQYHTHKLLKGLSHYAQQLSSWQ